MARLARVVILGHPHHVTQRGNGRAQTFFGGADYALYRDLLAAHCRAAEVEVWAWCLMPLAPIRDRFPRFADLLADEPEVDLFGRLRAAESVGRPLGDDAFLARVNG